MTYTPPSNSQNSNNNKNQKPNNKFSILNIQQLRRLSATENDEKLTDEDYDKIHVEFYDFDYVAVMSDVVFRLNFKQYLSKNQNDDSMLFFEDYNLLKTIKKKNKKKRYAAALNILNEYLKTGSNHSLNISSDVRKNVCVKWDDLFLEDDELDMMMNNGAKSNSGKKQEDVEIPDDLFDEAFETVCFELKQDSFPRYIQSDTLKEFLKVQFKKDMNYLKKFATLNEERKTAHYEKEEKLKEEQAMKKKEEKLKIIEKMRESVSSGVCIDELSQNDTEEPDFKEKSQYKKEEYQVKKGVSKLMNRVEANVLDQRVKASPYITPNDFELLIQEVMNESLWKIAKKSKSNKYRLFTSKDNYYIDDLEGIKKIKDEVIYDYPMHEVLRAIISEDSFKTFENKIKKSECVKVSRCNNSGKKDLSTSIYHFKCAMNFPLKQRDFVLQSSLLYDPFNQRYLCVYKKTIHLKCPEESNSVRGSYYGGFLLEKLTQNQSRLSIISHISMSGSSITTGSLYHKVLNNRSIQYHRNLEKIIQFNHAQTRLGKEDKCENGLYETLSNNMTYLKEKRIPVPSSNMKRE